VTTKLILDVDTGTDDAIAIMAAALHPDLDLVGLTTVNGNVPVDVVTENTLRVLDHIKVSGIPVREGAAKPIVRADFPVPRAERAGRTSGASMHGLYLELAEATSKKNPQHAVDYLIDYYMGPDGPDTVLVPTGPLTNIALAMSVEPAIVSRIPRIVLMGGGHEVGNVSPSAEFNVWADPEAARVVFAAGAKDVTVVPLDCTHEAVVSDEDCARMAALGTPAGEAASRIILRRIRSHDDNQPLARQHTAAVHDAVCVAYLLHPEVLERTGRYFVDVETSGELCVGRTVVDTHQRTGEDPNALVALGGNAKVLVDFLTETFARTA
jgi:inosine-uridine nucleoside N-ribohydrolase